MFGKAEKPKGKGENHITCQTFQGRVPNVAFTSSKSVAGFGLQPFYIKLSLSLGSKILREKQESL